MLKQLLFLSAIFFILSFFTYGQEVNVYCEDSSIVKGHLILVDKSFIKIHPAGPVTLRTFLKSEVDSVVTISEKPVLLFPRKESDPPLKIETYTPPKNISPLRDKFSLGAVIGFRFEMEAAEEILQDDSGDRV